MSVDFRIEQFRSVLVDDYVLSDRWWFLRVIVMVFCDWFFDGIFDGELFLRLIVWRKTALSLNVRSARSMRQSGWTLISVHRNWLIGLLWRLISDFRHWDLSIFLADAWAIFEDLILIFLHNVANSGESLGELIKNRSGVIKLLVACCWHLISGVSCALWCQWLPADFGGSWTIVVIRFGGRPVFGLWPNWVVKRFAIERFGLMGIDSLLRLMDN